jgi:hypothetical protein
MSRAQQKRSHTTEPLTCPPEPTRGSVDPEWSKVRYITQQFGIGRTTSFSLIADGTFKSVLLRRRNRKSGIRLVYIPSVREHLYKLAEEQHAP